MTIRPESMRDFTQCGGFHAGKTGSNEPSAQAIAPSLKYFANEINRFSKHAKVGMAVAY
jgi:hypothetical protein